MRLSGIAVGLLSLLSAPWVLTCGYYCWEQGRIREQVRSRMRAGLPDSVLVCWRLSAADGNSRLGEEDEFCRGDMWYDVVRREWRGDTLLLWCLPDYAESRLEYRYRFLLLQGLGRDVPIKRVWERLWLFLCALFWENVGNFSISGGRWTRVCPVEWAESAVHQNCISPFAPPPEPSSR